MSDGQSQPPASGGAPAGPALQFETAQPIAAAAATVPGAMACANCRQGLTSEYFEVGGQVICPGCRNSIGAALASAGGKERLVLATVYGGGAALVGALIWWGVRAATGYEVGLIAVAVGLLVGFAVRAGSQGRGGRRFQVLAVILTYLGITLNYVPDIIKGIGERADKAASKTADGAEKSAAADAPARSDAPAAKKAPGVLSLFVGLALIVGIAAAAPFLGGASNIIGLLIIGFALWEAWKVNRGMKVVINGPFRIGAVAPPAPGVP